MKFVRTLARSLAVAVLLVGGMTFAADGDVTLNGKFVWERGDSEVPGDIKAVFTPAGEDAWDVLFHFEWEGEDRTWAGTATGSLESGDLHGTGVEERDRQRTFVFRGKVEDGEFTGEHGAMRDGEMKKQGTLTLK